MPAYLSFEKIAGLEEEISTLLERHPSSSLKKVKQSLATKYNFRSWKQLTNFTTHDDEEAQGFLDLACLKYFHDDGPDRWQRARDMLATEPDMESESIYHACACGSLEHVHSYLDDDPELVDVPGGPMDWQPLLYSCYSRLNLPHRSTVEVAKVLLQRGADPNAHYMWGGQYRFTALTGAFGEGERGPSMQPPHVRENELVSLLLAHGARPNDGQAIYNRMFTGGVRHLRTLLSHGLTPEDTCNWLDVNKLGRFYQSKVHILSYLFDHALAKSHHEVIEVLLTAGVLLTQTQRRTAHRIALLNGDIETADQLLKFGLKEANLNEIERFVSACMHGDVDVLKKKEMELRHLCRRAMGRHPEILIDAVNRYRLRTIDILLDLGWDINDSTSGKTALHEAAYLGRLDLVDRFVALGADLRSRDQRFNSTPHQWALVNNQKETARYLNDALDTHVARSQK